MDKEKRYIDYVARAMLKEGVEKIFPGHCTGFEAISLLNGIYQDKCVEIYVGEEFEV